MLSLVLVVSFFTPVFANDVGFFAQERCQPEILRNAKLANPTSNPVEMQEYKDYIKCFEEQKIVMEKAYEEACSEERNYNSGYYTLEARQSLKDCREWFKKDNLPITYWLTDGRGNFHDCKIWLEKFQELEMKKYDVLGISPPEQLTHTQQNYLDEKQYNLDMYYKCKELSGQKGETPKVDSQGSGFRDVSSHETKSNLKIVCGEGTIDIDGICQVEKQTEHQKKPKKQNSFFSWLWGLFS